MQLDWSHCPLAESIPGRLNGAWVIRDTRMPIKLIFENLEAGATVEQIVEWYPGVSTQQVKAAVAFVIRTLENA